MSENKKKIFVEQEKITDLFVVRLPKYRKKLGLSQTEFGRLLGMSRQTISAIERKQVALSWDTLLAMVLVILANDEKILECEEYFDTIHKILTNEM